MFWDGESGGGREKGEDGIAGARARVGCRFEEGRLVTWIAECVFSVQKSFRVCGLVGSLVWVPRRNGENFVGSDLIAHPPPELFFPENSIFRGQKHQASRRH